MKLLSKIQYKAKECKRQVTKSQEVTTYQLPEASQSTAGQEYVLTIPETSLHSTCAASTDYHRTACYSDCERTATIGASIIIGTANFICCCGCPTAWDVQTDYFQPTFSCTFTTGGESAQHFWIIQSLRSYSQWVQVSTDGHTTAIFTLSTSTSTVTSAIFHSS